jgi:hypothetical protein
VALRCAVRNCLTGLLVLAGALWLSAPPAGAWLADGIGARLAPPPISSAFPDAVVDADDDSESGLAGIVRLLFGGEDDESAKVLASSFDVMPLRGAVPGPVDSDERLSFSPAFLSPFKTGPPTQ